MKRIDWTVLAVALTLPTVVTWLYFIVFTDTPWAPWVYGVGKSVQFGLPLAIWLIRRQGPMPVGPSNPQARIGRIPGLLLGAAFGTAVAWAISGLYFLALADLPAFADLGPKVVVKLRSMGLNTRGGFIVVAVFYALLHSGLEEFYWRMFVHGELEQRIRSQGNPGESAFWLPATISSLGFASHHVLVLAEYFAPDYFWVAFCSLGVAVGGWFWAWLYRRTGWIVGPWFSHCLVDAGLMWVGWEALGW